MQPAPPRPPRPASSPSATSARARSHGAEALARPVAQLMSKPARRRSGGRIRLSRDRPHEPAQGAPPRRHRRGGQRVGALSARDLLRLRAEEAVVARRRDRRRRRMCTSLGRGLGEAAAGRGRSAGRRRSRARRRRGDFARTRRADAPRRRASPKQRMRERRHGEPPCPYAVAVLGSAGRGESLLAMDQDNAIVFAEGAPGGPEDRWFATLGMHRRRHPARGRRALLQGRGDGEERAMARLGRDLARARRRLDRALQARRTCCRSISSSICAACTATAASPTRCGATPSTRAHGKAVSPSCWRKPPAQCEPALNFSGGFKTEQWPHRSEEGRPVRHRHRPRARWRSAITSSSARRRRGLRA